MTYSEMKDYIFYNVEIGAEGTELQHHIWNELASKIVSKVPVGQMKTCDDLELFEVLLKDFWVNNLKAAIEHKVEEIMEEKFWREIREDMNIE